MLIARFTTGEDPRFGIVEDDQLHVVLGDPLFTPLQQTGEKVPLEEVRLLAPVIPRSKLIGIGRNYAEHAAEMGGDVPSEPLVFFKPNTCVIGPGDPIQIPATSDEVHYEGELAVVIGRLCRDVPTDRVEEVILGYTCANDVSARDWQRRDGQWWRAKGADTFGPLGPYIATGLSLDDVADVAITTRLDGQVVQSGRTSDMVFDIAELIVHISAAMTLLPGDVILTGTPAGVGPIRAGQRVEVEIEGIGTLSNPVIDR